jgi:hypothetical protein
MAKDSQNCGNCLMFEFCIPTRSTTIPDGPDWTGSTKSILQVRQIDRSKAWVVERVDSSTDEYQPLVFFYVAIVGQSRREATFLAECYRKDRALQLIGCNWKTPYLQ